MYHDSITRIEEGISSYENAAVIILTNIFHSLLVMNN